MSWPVKDNLGHPNHIASGTRLEEVGGSNSGQEAGKCPEWDGRDAGDVDDDDVGDGRDAGDVDNDDVGDVSAVICQSR